MFVRVTRYKLKPGTREAATKKVHAMKPTIMGMPGMKEFIDVIRDDGTGYVVAVVESEETSNANAEAVKAAWGEMAEFLEEMPTPEGFDLVVHWSG